MLEKDIETLPGKRMSDLAFLCLAALTGSGLASVFVYKDGTVVFDVDCDLTMPLRRNVFDSLVTKGWITESPLQPRYWFVTEKGRTVAIDEAGRRLKAFQKALGFPCDPGKSFSYSVTVRALGCMRLVEMFLLRKDVGLTLETRGERLMAGETPTYLTYEKRCKDHYDPEGHAADLAAEAAENAAKTEGARIANERYAEERRARQIEMDARVDERRERQATLDAADANVDDARTRVLDLAKGCFLQTTSYDDLMSAVERLLHAEDVRRPLAA